MEEEYFKYLSSKWGGKDLNHFESNAKTFDDLVTELEKKYCKDFRDWLNGLIKSKKHLKKNN
uniref:Uncharacterized protein n=1 Tax=Meloidogyne enterolobii TaxID=390850 RepID=A0A6V7WSY8_MELEN|nr:unnamed protein product [Meloidogyne enterolobii]